MTQQYLTIVYRSEAIQAQGIVLEPRSQASAYIIGDNGDIFTRSLSCNEISSVIINETNENITKKLLG